MKFIIFFFFTLFLYFSLLYFTLFGSRSRSSFMRLVVGVITFWQCRKKKEFSCNSRLQERDGLIVFWKLCLNLCSRIFTFFFLFFVCFLFFITPSQFFFSLQFLCKTFADVLVLKNKTTIKQMIYLCIAYLAVSLSIQRAFVVMIGSLHVSVISLCKSKFQTVFEKQRLLIHIRLIMFPFYNY